MRRYRPRRTAGFLLGIVGWLGLLSALATSAVAESNMTVKVLESQATFPQPAAVVEIIDSRGRSVTGLRRDNFTVLQDGKPVTPDAVRVDETLIAKQGPTLALVLDASKLLGAAEVEAARAAAVALLQTQLETTPNDPEYVTLFIPAGNYDQPSDVREFADFTHDHNAVVNYLNTRLELQPGTTRLYAVVHDAIAAVGKKASERGTPAYLAIFSDGRDQLSASQFDVAVALARENNVRILSVRFGAAKGGEAGIERLQRLANETEGRFLNAPTPEAVSASYAQLAEITPRSTYRVSFTSSLPADDEVHSWQVLANVEGMERESQRILFQALLRSQQLRPLSAILSDYLVRAIPAVILLSGVLTLGLALWQRSQREDSRRLRGGLSDAATFKSSRTGA